MSVFNGASYLSEAIESVLNQTFTDFEFIIVNDGSSDDSKQIIESYAKSDARIRIIEQANMGLPASLNRGIAQARASLIARMDADDISLPPRFEKQLEVMQRGGYHLVGSGVLNIDEHGSIRGKRLLPETHSEIARQLPLRNCISHPTAIFSKDIFVQSGQYDVAFRNCQDYDLWLRMLPHGSMHNVSEPLLKYRKHLNKITTPANRALQTKYSVIAALNFFNRSKSFSVLSPSSTQAETAENLELLLGNCEDEFSRRCLIRHANRYLRYCVSEQEDRIFLKQLILKHATTWERFKTYFYEYC